MSKFFVLIPAAGSGSRLQGSVPKQYTLLAGRPMLARTIDAMTRVAGIHRIAVLLAAGDAHWRDIAGGFPTNVVAEYCGGATRAVTVRNGLDLLASEAASDDWVLVHDAARPCILPAKVEAMMATLRDDRVGGLLAQRVPDTIKRGAGGQVVATVPRDDLWLAQTPQMFRYALLREALSSQTADAATDEASAIEALGAKPWLIESDAGNLKITYATDMVLAEAILASRKAAG